MENKNEPPVMCPTCRNRVATWVFYPYCTKECRKGASE